MQHPASPQVAAESTKKIKILCEALGVPAEAADAIVRKQGPLCRNCLKDWGAGENDLDTAPRV